MIPGMAITLLVMATNLTGNWLRDRTDPTGRQLCKIVVRDECRGLSTSLLSGKRGDQATTKGSTLEVNGARRVSPLAPVARFNEYTSSTLTLSRRDLAGRGP